MLVGVVVVLVVQTVFAVPEPAEVGDDEEDDSPEEDDDPEETVLDAGEVAEGRIVCVLKMGCNAEGAMAIGRGNTGWFPITGVTVAAGFAGLIEVVFVVVT